MTESIRHVRKGERPRAQTVNQLIHAVDGLAAPHIAATSAQHQQGLGTADNLVRVKNTTGQPLQRGSVVSLADAANPPATSDHPQLDGVYFLAAPPNLGTPTAIVVEAIASGMVGLAQVYGVIQCRVRMDDAAHNYAVIEEGDCTALRSADAGPFRMLWRTPTGTASNVATALVNFPTATVVQGQASSGFKMHNHQDASWESGGMAFAIYAPGTSVPALPWQ